MRATAKIARMIITAFRHREIPDRLWHIVKSNFKSQCHRSIDGRASLMFEQATHLVLAWDLRESSTSNRPKLVIGGFALLQASPKSSPPHMYINAMCSKSQQGSELMLAAFALARRYGYKRMGIRPTAVVGDHYKRAHGFRAVHDACASYARRDDKATTKKRLSRCLR